MVNVLLQHLEYKAFFICRIEVAHIVIQEFFEYRCFKGRNGNDVLNGQDDANWHRHKVSLVLSYSVAVFNRGIYQDKSDVLVPFVAGSLIKVK